MIWVSPRGLTDLFVNFKGLENLYLCSEVLNLSARCQLQGNTNFVNYLSPLALNKVYFRANLFTSWREIAERGGAASETTASAFHLGYSIVSNPVGTHHRSVPPNNSWG